MVTTVLESASAGPVRGRVAGLAAVALVTFVTVVAATSSYVEAARKAPTPFDLQAPGLATWLIVVELAAAGALAAGVWAIRAQHSYAAAGLALACAGVVLPFWATGTWLPPAARSGVLAGSPLSVAGIALVSLRWGRSRSRASRYALLCIFVLAGAAVLVHLLGYNPFADPGCARVCDDVRPVLKEILDSRSAVEWSGFLTVAAAGIAAAAILLAGTPGTPRLIVLAALPGLAALTFTSVARRVTWAEPSPPLWWLMLNPLGVLVLGLTALVLGARTAQTRAAVRRLAARLSADAAELGPFAGAIRGVHFALVDGAGWVDANGRAASDPPASDAQAVLSDEAGPAIRLILADRVHHGDVLAGLSPATRLALVNARLAALARARLAAVRDSQRRIVATADAERRRIERDLHDGAQQTLVGAAFHIRASLREFDAGNAHLLTHAEAQVRVALAHLRQLAHGIFPTVLAEEGLEAAIEELASNSDLSITYDVQMPRQVRPEVAMAAYAMIAVMLDIAGSGAGGARARVSVLTDQKLTARVGIDGDDTVAQNFDFTDVADRVGAAGGTFRSFSDRRGHYVAVAVMPCAS